MQKHLKIAYIGGGSKQQARVFMSDLAVSDGLSGEIALYDTDLEAALDGVDFVIIRRMHTWITPADFKRWVNTNKDRNPAKYHVYFLERGLDCILCVLLKNLADYHSLLYNYRYTCRCG